MRPHELTRRTLDGIRKPVALRCNVSDSLVDQWCVEPVTDGGKAAAHTPVRRVVEAELELQLRGSARAGDFVRYICEQTGYLPPLRITDVPTDPLNPGVLAAVAKEHSEILATWARALANGQLSADEADDFRGEIRELITVLTAWDRGLNRYGAEGDYALQRERRGPKRVPRYYEVRRETA